MPGVCVDTRDPRTGYRYSRLEQCSQRCHCKKHLRTHVHLRIRSKRRSLPPMTVVEADTDRFALRVLVIVIAVLSLILALTTAVRPMTASAAVAPDLYTKKAPPQYVPFL